MALLATIVAACSSLTLTDVPSLVLWILRRQADPIHYWSKYALCPPTGWGISTRTCSGLVVATATNGLVTIIPVTSPINSLHLEVMSFAFM